MRPLALFRALPLLTFLLACGEDDPGPNRPEPGEEDASAADAGLTGDAQQGDGGPTLSLTAALEQAGVNADIERASLVVEAACKKLTSCGLLKDDAICTADTLMDWTVGSLFYQAECLDAQLDTFSCWAKSECGGQTSCSALRELQDSLCALE